MDLETLDELIKSCNDRSLDDFFALWRELSEGGRAEDEVMRLDQTIIGAYVARLRASTDVEAVLADLRMDKRVRARECIEIAARLLPERRRPRSRNRALAQIRAGRAAAMRSRGRRLSDMSKVAARRSEPAPRT